MVNIFRPYTRQGIRQTINRHHGPRRKDQVFRRATINNRRIRGHPPHHVSIITMQGTSHPIRTTHLKNQVVISSHHNGKVIECMSYLIITNNSSHQRRFSLTRHTQLTLHQGRVTSPMEFRRRSRRTTHRILNHTTRNRASNRHNNQRRNSRQDSISTRNLRSSRRRSRHRSRLSNVTRRQTRQDIRLATLRDNIRRPRSTTRSPTTSRVSNRHSRSLRRCPSKFKGRETRRITRIRVSSFVRHLNRVNFLRTIKRGREHFKHFHGGQRRGEPRGIQFLDLSYGGGRGGRDLLALSAGLPGKGEGAVRGGIRVVRVGVSNRSGPKVASSLARVLTHCSTFVLSVNRTGVRRSLALNVLFGAATSGSNGVVGRLLFGTSRLNIVVHFAPVSRQGCRS